MTIGRRLLLAGAAVTLAPLRARAASETLRVGVLTDLSGPYRDLLGPLGIDCGRQAVTDFAPTGFAVEILSADHQNKADIGTSIARQWFDRDGVDIIVEGGSSSVALAVSVVAHEKNKVYINSGASTSDLTGAKCNANTIHWVYDGYMLSRSTCTPLVRAGGKTWFFIAADYAFGHALVRDATGFIKAAGGDVIGTTYYPFPGTSDFSSLLVQAQASGADVVAFANSGTDLINCIKQAHEFGIAARLAGLLMFITDVHSLGLPTAQGLIYTDSFYWDYNDRTRAFSERVRHYAPDRRPSMINAGVYSSVLHYLKTAQAMGATEAKRDGAATVAAMKRLPTDDDAFGPGRIRDDGRKLCPAFLWQVKTPAESHGPWDYCKLLSTTPADQAFRPEAEGGCKMGKPS
jgi:branched-chain amino acid transport system substrate-binding protein